MTSSHVTETITNDCYYSNTATWQILHRRLKKKDSVSMFACTAKSSYSTRPVNETTLLILVCKHRRGIDLLTKNVQLWYNWWWYASLQLVHSKPSLPLTYYIKLASHKLVACRTTQHKLHLLVSLEKVSLEHLPCYFLSFHQWWNNVLVRKDLFCLTSRSNLRLETVCRAHGIFPNLGPVELHTCISSCISSTLKKSFRYNFIKNFKTYIYI